MRLGFRGLRRDRLFAVSVTTILALGIGLSVTMFSVLHAVVLEPLPYARQQELVRISTHLIAQNRWDGSSLANILDWDDQSETFAAHHLLSPNRGHDGHVRGASTRRSGRRKDSSGPGSSSSSGPPRSPVEPSRPRSSNVASPSSC